MPTRAELEARIGRERYAEQLEGLSARMDAGATPAELLCDMGWVEDEIEAFLTWIRGAGEIQ